jgi:hypothetical protein
MALLVERHSKTKDDEESLCRASSFVPLGSVIVVWIERCDTETAKVWPNSYYLCRVSQTKFARGAWVVGIHVGTFRRGLGFCLPLRSIVFGHSGWERQNQNS